MEHRNLRRFGTFFTGKGDDVSGKKMKLLEYSHGSFKGLKEDRRNSVELVKACLVPSLSFNEKIITSANIPHSQRRKSTVIRLSVTRTSIDGEEATELCKFLINYIRNSTEYTKNKYLCNESF